MVKKIEDMSVEEREAFEYFMSVHGWRCFERFQNDEKNWWELVD